MGCRERRKQRARGVHLLTATEMAEVANVSNMGKE
jgi:hypothetical protein